MQQYAFIKRKPKSLRFEKLVSPLGLHSSAQAHTEINSSLRIFGELNANPAIKISHR
jgi:hypothetical protein